MTGHGADLWSDHLYPPGGQMWSLSQKFRKPNETIDFPAKNCIDMNIKYLKLYFYKI